MLALIGCSLFISGCTSPNEAYREYIENGMLKSAGIENDQDYVLSHNLEGQGMLDVEGKYVGNADELLNIKPISVSINSTNSISFDSYLDEALSEKIDEFSTVNPGDCIYVNNIVCDSANTDCYALESVRLVAYDDEGNRLAEYVDEVKCSTLGSGNTIILHIPDTYSGTEVAIEAVGHYYDRELVLSAFYIGTQGQKCSIDGIWKVNEKIVNPVDCYIEPSIGYTVKFEYDAERFYFDGIDSNYYSVNSGCITYNRQEPIGGESDYSLKLYPYAGAIISDSSKALISLKIGDENNAIGKKNYEISKLKKNDWIIFETKKEYKVKFGDENLVSIPTTNGYKYTFQIPGDSEEIYYFNIEPFENKNIDINADKNNVIVSAFAQIGIFFTDTFVGKKPEESLLYIDCGGRIYTYEELVNGKKVEIYENEKLKFVVNKSNLNGMVLHIVFNENDIYTVSDTSNIYEFEFDYNEITKISIEGAE